MNTNVEYQNSHHFFSTSTYARCGRRADRRRPTGTTQTVSGKSSQVQTNDVITTLYESEFACLCMPLWNFQGHFVELVVGAQPHTLPHSSLALSIRPSFAPLDHSLAEQPVPRPILVATPHDMSPHFHIMFCTHFPHPFLHSHIVTRTHTHTTLIAVSQVGESSGPLHNPASCIKMPEPRKLDEWEELQTRVRVSC